jgi:Fe-S oxidoreductase
VARYTKFVQTDYCREALCQSASADFVLRAMDFSPSRRYHPGMTPDHQTALQLCTYCPKLCRFSCPVSETTVKETLTPWGKMSSLRRTEISTADASSSAKNTPFACTGCGRCQEYCKHHVDVSASLFPGRKHALESGDAPTPINDLVASFAERERALTERTQSWRKTGLSAFHPGCSVLKHPALLDDAQAVLEALAPGEFAIAAQGNVPCCGYPLYAAGAIDKFRSYAQTVARRFARGRLLVADPECAYTFQELYPKYGARLESVVETLPNFVEGRLPKQPKKAQAPVQYHDACYLGRRLGVYDAPRKVLTWATGSAPEEFAQNKKDAPCSGGGGLLPASSEAMSDAITAQAISLAKEHGEHTIVSACANATERFQKNNANAEHWLSVVRKALDI